MNPDLEKRVPREILEELIEEGTEAFRGILEKLFNVAMQLERSEFLGAEAYERTENRRGYRNGFKGKRIQTRVGELHLEIPQVRGLRFYPKSLERGCRSEKALKLAIAEMYVMGVSTRKVTEITEQLCGLEISATQVSRVAGMLDEELEEFRSRELGEYPIVYLDAHYEKVRRGGRVQDVAILKAIGVMIENAPGGGSGRTWERRFQVFPPSEVRAATTRPSRPSDLATVIRIVQLFRPSIR